MDRGKSILLPGQSSQSPTNAPAPHHEPVPPVAGPSTLQPENHEVVQSAVGPSTLRPDYHGAIQSAAGPSTLRPEFHDVVPSAAVPSTLQPEEDSSESINTNWDNDDTDSSSDESMPREDPEVKEKIQRRLAFYQEMFDKSFEQHVEERAEGTRKRKAEDLTGGKSLQMELEHHHDYIKNCFKKGMEEANMQGYVYGIIIDDNKVLSGSSESLRKWWDQTIIFEHIGPAVADKFYSENQVNVDLANNEPPRRTYDLLMQLSDGTMAAVLSALVSKCHPPQRKFPYQNSVAPPWWPTGDEPWWDQTSLEREPGQPQYRKPHDLKKKWKAVVVLSVIKNLAPNFEEIVQTVLHSKNLQDRLTVTEMNAWNSALKEEMKVYSQEHPDMPLSSLLRVFQAHDARVPGDSSSNPMHEATGLPQQPPLQQQLPYQQQHQVIPMANEPGDHRMLPVQHVEMLPQSNQRRMLRFTCKNQGCIHRDNDFGFLTAAVRDNHQRHCKFQSPMNQFAATGDFSQFASMGPPLGSTTQVIVPPMHRAQQLVQPPFPTMPPAQTTPLPQMFGSNAEIISPQQPWLFSAGVPNYPSIPSSSRNMAQIQPGFNSGRFYHTQGSSGGGGSNTGSYMQLLNKIHSNGLLMPPEQHLQGANLSMHQGLTGSFPYGGGEGSSSGVFQQTGFQPFEPTEMQLLSNDPTMDPRFACTQTNVSLAEGTQFELTGPPDCPLAPSQPNVSIPQASDLQQSASYEVQTPPASEEPNQFATGNSDLGSDSSFFQ